MSKNKFNNKPLAIFDLDGTFFRDSLFIVITKAMCNQEHEGGFPCCRLDHHKAIEKAELEWKNREGSYGDYLEVVFQIFCDNIQGVEKDKFEELSRKIIRSMYNRVHIFTRELFNVCRENYHVVALTGSQVETVKVFHEFWPFDTIIGSIYEVDDKGFYTGVLKYSPFKDKRAAVLNLVNNDESLLKGSIGIGDSSSDIPMLEVVDKKILFNASNSLKKKIDKMAIDHISVIERKDSAWVIKDNSVEAWSTADIEDLKNKIRDLIK